MAAHNQSPKELAQDILERHDISYKKIGPSKWEPKSVCDVFVVDDEYVIKIGNREIQREQAIYKALNSRETPLPRLVATGDRYLVIEKLEGEPLDKYHQQLSLDDRISLAWQIGFSLAHIQKAPVDMLLHCREIYQRTSDNLISGLRASAADAGGLHKPEVAEQIRTYIAQEIWRAKIDFEPVLVHADLWDRHLFVKPTTDGRCELCGIIDFTDAFIGPPEYDLVYGPYWIREIGGGTAALLSGYRSACGKLEPDFVGRLRLYQLLQCPIRISYWVEQCGNGNLRRALEWMWPDKLLGIVPVQ